MKKIITVTIITAMKEILKLLYFFILSGVSCFGRGLFSLPAGVGAVATGASVVGASVVGASVVGASVVSASVVGASVVGASVVSLLKASRRNVMV